MSENQPKPHELFTVTLYTPSGEKREWKNARNFGGQGNLFVFLDENGLETGFPLNACYTMEQQAPTPQSKIIQTVGNNRPSLNIVGGE